MTVFLLDTNIPSELIRPRPEPRVATWLQGIDNEQLFLSVITLGEIRKGFTVLPERARRQKLEQWLEQELRPWFAERILSVDEAVAERWGALDGARQLQGTPLNTADGLIAATAIEHGLVVVTRNVKDFAGLAVELFNPWEGR
jgi:predicted nucleic acid-binding protein